MAKYADDYYREYLERFKDYSDIDIITALNRELGNPGWGTARSGYLSAMRYEFNRKEKTFPVSVLTMLFPAKREGQTNS